MPNEYIRLLSLLTKPVAVIIIGADRLSCDSKPEQ